MIEFSSARTTPRACPHLLSAVDLALLFFKKQDGTKMEGRKKKKTEPGTSVGKKREFNMIGWEGAEEISKGKVCSMP